MRKCLFLLFLLFYSNEVKATSGMSDKEKNDLCLNNITNERELSVRRASTYVDKLMGKTKQSEFRIENRKRREISRLREEKYIRSKSVLTDKDIFQLSNRGQQRNRERVRDYEIDSNVSSDEECLENNNRDSRSFSLDGIENFQVDFVEPRTYLDVSRENSLERAKKLDRKVKRLENPEDINLQLEKGRYERKVSRMRDKGIFENGNVGNNTIRVLTETQKAREKSRRKDEIEVKNMLSSEFAIRLLKMAPGALLRFPLLILGNEMKVDKDGWKYVKRDEKGKEIGEEDASVKAILGVNKIVEFTDSSIVATITGLATGLLVINSPLQVDINPLITLLHLGGRAVKVIGLSCLAGATAFKSNEKLRKDKILNFRGSLPKTKGMLGKIISYIPFLPRGTTSALCGISTAFAVFKVFSVVKNFFLTDGYNGEPRVFVPNLNMMGFGYFG